MWRAGSLKYLRGKGSGTMPKDTSGMCRNAPYLFAILPSRQSRCEIAASAHHAEPQLHAEAVQKCATVAPT
jgi:hypothetical protein